jgi:prepilin-type N-terminal cleavage/methylation domain-containing protein
MYRLLQQVRRRSTLCSGFSLIELLVSISIIVIITSIALVRNSSFNQTILLTNQAYELALDIRRSQVLGVSVQAGAEPGSDAINRSPIGLYVEQGNQTYRIFRDNTNDQSNGQYDPGEEINNGTLTLDNRFRILYICEGDLAADTCTGTTWTTILFQRPDFTAHLNTNSPSNVLTKVRIGVSTLNRGSETREVIIESTGLISVQ